MTFHPLHEQNRYEKAARLVGLIHTLHADLKIPIPASEWASAFTPNIWRALGAVLKEKTPPNTSIEVAIQLLEAEEDAAGSMPEDVLSGLPAA